MVLYVGVVPNNKVGQPYCHSTIRLVKLIVTVILHFTTIGLTTYITNVLRLLQMRAQAVLMKKEAIQQAERQETAAATSDEQKSLTHVRAIRYNRVIIGLIIDAMLVAFLNLAGLDSVQG